MREFNKVSPTIWQDADFQKLPFRERYTFLYLRTCQHQSSAGCFMLPEGYALVDLGGWDAKTYRESIKAVETAGLITTDPETSEVLINGWFDDNGPMNNNHRISIQRNIDAIKSPTLKKIAQDRLDAFWTASEIERGKNPPRSGKAVTPQPVGVSDALRNQQQARANCR
jgi:hypothetical protein